MHVQKRSERPNLRIILDKDGVLADVIKPGKISWVNITRRKISKYLADDFERLSDEKFKEIFKKAGRFNHNEMDDIPTYVKGLAYVLAYVVHNEENILAIQQMLNRIKAANITNEEIRMEYAKLAYDENMFPQAVEAIELIPSNVEIFVVSSAKEVLKWVEKEIKAHGIDRRIIVYDDVEHKTDILKSICNGSRGIFFTDTTIDVNHAITAKRSGVDIDVFGVLTGLDDLSDFKRLNVEAFETLLKGIKENVLKNISL